MIEQESSAKPSQSVLTAVAMLEVFNSQNEELTLAQISRALSAPKASCLRHLKALVQTGYVNYDPDRKVYAQGPAVLALAQRFISQHASVLSCRPYLSRIADSTGETAHFGVLLGREVIYLDIAESPRRVRAVVGRGDRSPAHVTASGKAILAYSASETIDAILRSGIEALTEHSITSPRAFWKEIAITRKRGFGTNLAEWMDQVGAVSAPVFSESGSVIGAIGVAGPIARVNESSIDEIGRIVCEHANEFSRRSATGQFRA